MKITDFLSTVRFLQDAISERVANLLLSDGLLERIRGNGVSSLDDQMASDVLLCSNDLAAVRQEILDHPFASSVLRVYQIPQLVDPELGVDLLKDIYRPRDASGPESINSLFEKLHKLRYDWANLIQNAKRMEELLVPKAIVGEEPFDEILTIEVNFEGETLPQPSFLRSILENVESLYASVAYATGNREYSPLTVVFMSSGTGFRFDLKGLGEPIKQIKELILEGWTRIRHRKADELNHRNDAALGGLHFLNAVATSADNGTITHEEALRIKDAVLKNIWDLYGAGVSIRELPSREIVSNSNLLLEQQQRLLSPPPMELWKDPEDNEEKNVAPAKAPRRRSSPAQKKGTTTKKNPRSNS